MIDTKRLATDAGYWNEVAPEGAETFGPDEGLFVAGWYKQNHNGVYFMAEDGHHWQLTYPMQRELIPRPQAPEAEWVDGLPGVGVECESAARGAGYRVGHITYLSDQILVWMDKLSGHEYAARPHDREFRPLLTPEQRQRDELAVEIWAANGGTKDKAFTVADAILSRYNLEPKP